MIPRLLVLLLAVPGALHAQELRRILQRADNNNWQLRIVMRDSAVTNRQPHELHSVFTDQVHNVDDASARFGETRVQFDDIIMLEREKRVGSGFLAGAIAGTLTMGLAATGFWAGACDADAGCNREPNVVVLTLFAVGIGTAIGGMIGELAQPGRPVYEEIWRR